MAMYPNMMHPVPLKKFKSKNLKRKKNGRWKKYKNKSNLEFEGEYLKGKKWNGKTNEYHNNGQIKFEGEYLNGEKNGKCKE